MAVEQPIHTEEPTLAAVAMEEEPGNSSQSCGSDDWCQVPGEADATTTELAAFWQKKAEEQERLRLKAESEVIEFRNRWQQQVQEAEARKQEAKEEASMWQDKATEQSALRVKAEAEAAKWENKAEREEGRWRKAERDAAEAEQKAEREESWRTLWQEKAVAEESLCARYQQEVQSAEGHRRHWQEKAQEQASLLEEQAKVLEHEKALRLTAEASAAEWQGRAHREESCHAEIKQELESCRVKLERELEQWMQLAQAEETFRRRERKAKVEENLRKEWEKKALQREQDMEAHVLKKFEETLKEKDAQLAEANAHAGDLARMKKAQDEAAILHRYARIGTGQCWVLHRFKGMQAARKKFEDLYSPEMSFEGMEGTGFSYSFKIRLRRSPNGGVQLSWVPLPGRESKDKLQWPIPHEKVEVILRIVSASEGATKRRVKECSLVDGSAVSLVFLAKHAPPKEDNEEGKEMWMLTGEEFTKGGWTLDANGDEMIVQAGLILK